jgi:predicted ATPase
VLPNGEAVNRYGFIHALYQNVLYERASAFKRVQLHRRIGVQLETLHGDRVEEIAAELAMHFERGADYSQAVAYVQRAADNDTRRFAYREAVALSRHGLELIERLPETPERARQELELLITLGMPLIATEGYAAPGVGRLYTRARELCMQHGDTAEISQVLWGLWTFFVVRADLETSREITDEYLRVAGRVPYSNLAMGITLMHLGEFAPAMQFFETTLSLYDPDRHRIDAFRYSQNPAVAAQCHGAWTPWFLGEPDRALARMRNALILARELSEPHGLAHVCLFVAVLHQLRRESSLAQEFAEASVAVSTEHNLVLYQAAATVVRGWTLIDQGQAEEAVDEIRQGLAAYEATGTSLLRPHFLALLADALGKARKIEEGLKVLDEAMATADANGEHYYDAEIYRLRGELLLQQTVNRVHAAAVGKSVVDADSLARTTAEHCFTESIAIAQRQNAKSLQLRAAMSAARFYRDQGMREQARALLSQIHDTFTEGFDTKDLREAKVMLDELS